MEVWDLYDKKRRYIGTDHVRGEKLPEGAYHLCVHVWIKNKEGKYLISRRSANRSNNPLLWECVGGSVIKGESSLDGALRETKEEVGIPLDAKKGRVLFTKVRTAIDGIVLQDIMDVWLFDFDGNAHLEDADTDEVCETLWLEPQEIRTLYDNGELVPTLDYFFSAMDSVETDYKDIIGKSVKGKIDRPLGSRHPRHTEMIYPVNYGYVDGVLGGDGAWQDVYFLGVKEPCHSFEGTVIAVFHRFNDIENKWIVVPDGVELSDDEILGEIAFQEQFFYGKLYR